MTQQPRPTSKTDMTQHLNRQGAAQTVVTFEEQVRKWFKENGRRMAALCGSLEEANRVMLAALQAINKVPQLAECTVESFALCLMTSAELRLYPGASQECAYAPFNNSQKGVKEATFMLQYPGLCQLLYRSGMIKDIEADIVCANDYFKFTRGSNRDLVFEPAEGDLDSRGEWQGVYCIVRNIFGGQHIIYMTASEVMSIKARSKASGFPSSPWNSPHALDRALMWMKTALKRNSKFLPKSATTSALAQAFSADSDEESQPEQHRSITGSVGKQIAAPKPESDTLNMGATQKEVVIS